MAEGYSPKTLQSGGDVEIPGEFFRETGQMEPYIFHGLYARPVASKMVDGGGNADGNVEAEAGVNGSKNGELGNDLKKEKLCIVCLAPGTHSCSACLMAYYCCVDHQKKDWSAHKKNCRMFVLNTNEEFGRHLVAARKLKAGTLLIEEDAVWCSPRGPVEDYTTPICLSCCGLMKNDRALYRCSNCDWPICSWACEQYALHAENECKVFKDMKVPFPPPNEYPVYIIYKVIEILRGVLIKNRNPQMWEKMMDLQYKTDLGNINTSINDLAKLRETVGAQGIGEEEDWRRVLGIINVNNFAVAGPRGGEGPSFTGYIFLKASMFAHSCAPNCWWGVSMHPDPKMHVRTTVDIQKGEILTVSYSYLYNAFGTQKRHELIKQDSEFICKCRRCIDPTELNSFTAALHCGGETGCKTGLVLPIDPIDENSEWKCQGCSRIYPTAEIKELQDFMMLQLEDCQTVVDMENFIKEHEGVTVHPNHWLLTEAKEVLLKNGLFVFDKDELLLVERNRHIGLLEHLLKVKNIVAPGFSQQRAKLLNLLARARLEKLGVLVRQKLLTDSEEIMAEADLIFLLFDEALSFYDNDITEIPFSQIECLKSRVIKSEMRSVHELFAKCTRL